MTEDVNLTFARWKGSIWSPSHCGQKLDKYLVVQISPVCRHSDTFPDFCRRETWEPNTTEICDVSWWWVLVKNFQLQRPLKAARIDPEEGGCIVNSGICCDMRLSWVFVKIIFMLQTFPNYLYVPCYRWEKTSGIKMSEKYSSINYELDWQVWLCCVLNVNIHD